MKRLANHMLENVFSQTKNLIAWISIFVTLGCLAIVLLHYCFAEIQAVRWPTRNYFIAALFLSILSKKWSTFFVIFSLPLLPELHIQAAYVFKPAVQYFVAYPGIDIVAGFAIGTFLHVKFVEGKSLRSEFRAPPWPIGLLLIVLTASTAIAIARNLWRTDQPFDLIDMANSAIKYKLLSKLDTYFPLSDLTVHAVAVVFFVTLTSIMRGVDNKVDLVFKPIIFGLLLSAILGIFQALTSYGLPPNTSLYRPENFGFAAQAFQPDLHAFAGHMLVGTVGLLAYYLYAKPVIPRWLLFAVWSLCWIALILSKSRASFLLSAVTTIVLGFVIVSKLDVSRLSKVGGVVICGGGILAFAIFTNNLSWLRAAYETLSETNLSDFSTLNQLSRDRLDLHGAALRMALAFPIFGIGLGLFFPLSAIKEFSGSPFMTLAGGENAHNYFLQTFAEVGLLGIFCILLVFLYPIQNRQQDKQYLVAVFGILAIFYGNIYSHSLIIRENLFFLVAMIALLYAVTMGHDSEKSARQKTSCYFFIKGSVVFLLLLLLFFFGLAEVSDSFDKTPFTPFN
jgi:hypothetical protein